MKFKVFINSFQYASLITTIVLFDRVYRGMKIHALKFKFKFAFFYHLSQDWDIYVYVLSFVTV